MLSRGRGGEGRTENGAAREKGRRVRMSSVKRYIVNELCI